MSTMKVVDMPDGTWFTSGRQVYLKLATNSGEIGDDGNIIPYHYHASTDQDHLTDDAIYFNVVTSDGIPKRFGYWEEFEVIDNPFPFNKRKKNPQ